MSFTSIDPKTAKYYALALVAGIAGYFLTDAAGTFGFVAEVALLIALVVAFFVPKTRPYIFVVGLVIAAFFVGGAVNYLILILSWMLQGEPGLDLTGGLMEAYTALNLVDIILTPILLLTGFLLSLLNRRGAKPFLISGFALLALNIAVNLVILYTFRNFSLDWSSYQF